MGDLSRRWAAWCTWNRSSSQVAGRIQANSLSIQMGTGSLVWKAQGRQLMAVPSSGFSWTEDPLLLCHLQFLSLMPPFGNQSPLSSVGAAGQRSPLILYQPSVSPWWWCWLLEQLPPAPYLAASFHCVGLFYSSDSSSSVGYSSWLWLILQLGVVVSYLSRLVRMQGRS